jgi:hypothetical protein
MNSRNSISDISYFRLSLVDFLCDSHPERLDDDRFITTRADVAAETHTQAVMNGSSDIQADKQAHRILFRDLHFSEYAKYWQ